ncbi:hypothetical protein GCM10011396_33820 [Undibacterium terreum]|uniref:Uncharacterized protein n=1 Tax=Undibacterium terreum TaxID=1224302 RepID=A0A916UQQ2_9BURK|nr:hypothetical protein GCM10011396_33820 [Undibacterium terreum]
MVVRSGGSVRQAVELIFSPNQTASFAQMGQLRPIADYRLIDRIGVYAGGRSDPSERELVNVYIVVVIAGEGV